MSTETGSIGDATAAYAHHKKVAAALSAAAALVGKDGQLAGVGQLLEQGEAGEPLAARNDNSVRFFSARRCAASDHRPL
jgi:hypothetical protein